MASASSSADDGLVDPQGQEKTTEESAGNATQTTAKTKKKKKILVQGSAWYVKHVLSFKPEELKEPEEVPEAIVKHDPVLAANLYVMMANSALYREHIKEKMLEEQSNFRHQLKTKGRVTHEIEVDEDDDRFVNVAASNTGTGRRRHRPGIMKKEDGQTRKLN